MAGRSGGHSAKDALISDNFNTIKLGARVTKGDIAKARRIVRLEKQRQEAEKRKRQEELALLSDKLARVGKKIGVDVGQEAEPEREEVIVGSQVSDSDIQDADDLKSAYQMLQDMRWVYRNVKGRTKLRNLVKEDDKQFVFMVKELMKIEASLMAAKIRKNEESDGQKQRGFYVVIKGLEEEKKYSSVIKADKTVDIEQIRRAINPDLDEVSKAEKEIGQRGAPEQLRKEVLDEEHLK